MRRHVLAIFLVTAALAGCGDSETSSERAPTATDPVPSTTPTPTPTATATALASRPTPTPTATADAPATPRGGGGAGSGRTLGGARERRGIAAPVARRLADVCRRMRPPAPPKSGSTLTREQAAAANRRTARLLRRLTPLVSSRQSRSALGLVQSYRRLQAFYEIAAKSPANPRLTESIARTHLQIRRAAVDLGIPSCGGPPSAP